jgi:methyltransferase-like protein/cyclopropane fatty-acyl-phospholipid synthase-like methyltransferase
VSGQSATSYDEVPYINRSFPQTHPDRLATLATLFGVATADIAHARVLELGSASGDNLIPMALSLPRSQFLGIDLSARQTEQGRDIVRTLGIDNIELRHADIADVDDSYGRFDYIICHGIYSWVPEAIQEKILEICRRNLAPQGVAYISYNTLPGRYMHAMARDMMVYQSRELPDANTKLKEARALLEFVAKNVTAQSPYRQILEHELDAVRNQPDAYVFHEHLAEINEPFYFHEFAESAARYGLQYLADANFSSMMISNFPPQVGEVLRRVAHDVVRMEQYIDFLRNRTFRETLLVHQGVPVNRQVDGKPLASLYVASPAQATRARPSLTPGTKETFRAPNGATLATSDPVTKAALLLLAERWPLGLPFEQLAVESRARLRAGSDASSGVAMSPTEAQVLANDMLKCYAADMLELRVKAPPMTLALSTRPVASALARLQAERGLPLTNLRHGRVILDEFSLRLLRLLDGTRDRDALLAMLGPRAEDTAPPTARAHQQLVIGGPTEQALQAAMEKSLSTLAKFALISE